MGRTRKAGNTASGTSSSVSDVLLSLYDVGGFLSSDDRSDATSRHGPTQRLVTALRRLAALLEALGSGDSRTSSAAMAPLFVQAESLLRELRDDLVPAASASRQKDAELVLRLRRDLESAGATTSSQRGAESHSHWPWRLLGFSLVEALLRQLGEEHDACSEAEAALDFVFLGADGHGPEDRATRALETAVYVLERRSLLKNRTYVAALEELVAAPRSPTIEAPSDVSPPPLLAVARRRSDVREPPEPRRCPCFGASTAEGAAEQFLRAPATGLSKLTALLVVGDPGSGKTRLCDRIERGATAAAMGAAVVRPNVPLDFLGGTVGADEDRIVSMFAACATHEGKAILIVDDVEVLLGCNAEGGESRPDAARWRQTFLAALDGLQESLPPDSAVLLVCTSADETTASIHRFDRTYYLALPDEDARREFFAEVLDLSQHLGTGSDAETQRLRDGLESVVESSAGRSYAEMMQLCRQALLVGPPNDSSSSSSYQSALDGLERLKGRLSSLTPASLRDSVLDSYVDLRVVGSRDLTDAVEEGAFEVGEQFPFRGSSAVSAWNQLLATIVVPLCRSRELNDLLDCSGSGSRRVLAGGILLTGPPGSGKSALALHCATYAASLSPAVKLLEVSCTSMIHKELGGSERAVHHLFEAARRASPCVVVLDGIENIAAVRGNDPTTEGTLDRVLSTLLVELDGVDDFSESGNFSIAVIGITSEESWIDAAVKRPGRLEKTVRLAIDWT